MNVPELPTPPAGSLVVVSEIPSGLEICFPAPGWRIGRKRIRGSIICLSLCAVLLAVLIIPGLNDPVGSVFMFGFYGSGLLFYPIDTLLRSQRRIVVRMSSESLQIQWNGLLRRQTWQWAAGELQSIHIREERLCVRNTRAERKLFRLEDPELRWNTVWLVNILREFFHLAVDRPRPGELAVTYADLSGREELAPERGEVLQGHLSVAAGRLALRDWFADTPTFTFRVAQEGDAFRSMSKGIPLLPMDVLCRVTDDGATVLQIMPTRMNLSLMVWCDDPEVLPRALARFWGAEG